MIIPIVIVYVKIGKTDADLVNLPIVLTMLWLFFLATQFFTSFYVIFPKSELNNSILSKIAIGVQAFFSLIFSGFSALYIIMLM